jgi:hypothetical protein
MSSRIGAILLVLVSVGCGPLESGSVQQSFPQTEIADLPPVTAAIPPTSGPDQVYARAEFDCGIAVSYPAHWGVLTREMDLNIRANAEARGTNPSPTGRRTLLLLNSTPEPHGAQLRLVVSPAEPDVTQENFLAMASDHAVLGAITEQMLEQFRSGEAQGGVRVVTMRPARVERLGDHAAMHLSYDRESMLGGSNWRVDQYQIPIGTSLLQFTISYRIEEAEMWAPILTASLASLDVGGGC